MSQPTKEINFAPDGTNVNITINCDTQKFNDCDNLSVLRYLKGIYTNKERFYTRFIKRIEEIPAEHEMQVPELIKYLMDNYDKVEPFTYAEAFKIKDDTFKAQVFGSINIGEMIQNLGAVRLCTDGKEMMQKFYDNDGNFIETREVHNIYEVYEVDGKGLNLEEKLYVVKCWCTTTNKEHWLWIDEQHKNNPLEAIASTFHVYEDILPHIKALKRQGDILLIEVTNEGATVEITAESKKIPLTAKQYFGFLEAQS